MCGGKNLLSRYQPSPPSFPPGLMVTYMLKLLDKIMYSTQSFTLCVRRYLHAHCTSCSVFRTWIGCVLCPIGHSCASSHLFGHSPTKPSTLPTHPHTFPPSLPPTLGPVLCPFFASKGVFRKRNTTYDVRSKYRRTAKVNNRVSLITKKNNYD